MSKCKFDSLVLLQTHGELSPIEALKLKLHMSRCRDCQERATQLGAFSRTVAGAVLLSSCSPHYAASAAAAPNRVAPGWKRLALIGVATALLTTLAVAAYYWSADRTDSSSADMLTPKSLIGNNPEHSCRTTSLHPEIGKAEVQD